MTCSANLSPLDIDQAVAVTHARGPMCDDDHRNAPLKCRERFYDTALGRFVEVGCRFVKDENAWAGIKRAGKSDALTLASGEPNAPLANKRFEAIWEPRDNVLKAGESCRSDTRASSISSPYQPSATFARSVSSTR